MCGFSLLVHRSGEVPEHMKSLLEQVNVQFIKTRGPTYQRVLEEPGIYAYQSVLAIQGDAKSPEPIDSLIYNGEVYSWPSKYDEVIDKNQSDTFNLIRLQRHGRLEEFLRDADSMHALCALSRHQSSITNISIYRDISGEKHVWYFKDAEYLIVSSVPAVITAFLKCVGKFSINLPVLADYMLRRHLISPIDHVISGIKQVQPGHKLTLCIATWNLDEEKLIGMESLFSSELYKRSMYVQTDVLASLESVMSQMIGACGTHVRQAGIFSGGIDSSLASYLLSKSVTGIDLYTLLVERKDSVAESAFKLIKHLRGSETINHRQIQCSLAEYHSSLIECITLLSSPVNTHSLPSAHIVAMTASKAGNTVIYGGEGADELFLGYGTYSEHSRSAYNSLGHNFKENKCLLDLAERSGIERYISDKKMYFSNYLSGMMVAKEDINILSESLIDLTVQLPNVGFVATDTVNSHLGIETRTPFPRREILRLGLSLNPQVKKDKYGTTKIPLRKAFQKAFSTCEVLPKSGFSGFPNETKHFLPTDRKKWLVNEIFGFSLYNEEPLSRDEEWKLVNIEFFLRTVVEG